MSQLKTCRQIYHMLASLVFSIFTSRAGAARRTSWMRARCECCPREDGDTHGKEEPSLRDETRFSIQHFLGNACRRGRHPTLFGLPSETFAVQFAKYLKLRSLSSWLAGDFGHDRVHAQGLYGYGRQIVCQSSPASSLGVQ